MASTNKKAFVRTVSSAAEWEGKHALVEKALSQIKGVGLARVKHGTRGRPIDGIYITADSSRSPNKTPKKLVSDVEVVLKNLFNLFIDYRVVSIGNNHNM